ncbi:MAG: hypothetical protein LCH67_04465 [Bacteroidetes bacterium]|nr:hypothetical protein [Bacteroidota bacterium]
MNRLTFWFEFIFNKLEEKLSGKNFDRLLSTLLVIVFLVSQLIALVNDFNPGILPVFLKSVNHFSGITITFNFLLYFELLGLIFVIPHSIANSIGKQYEILSLILLRSAFEEFAHYNFHENFEHNLPEILKMFSDGAGALIIFGLTLIFYAFQKHRQITLEPGDKEIFVRLKKVVASGVFLSFIFIGFRDLIHLLLSGHFVQSFQLFYLMLIFADMLFLLISLRYEIHYANIFRYSAFVLITIFIRMSLLAPVYYNGIMGVFSVLFGISLIYLHNRYFEVLKPESGGH